jgi:hypothetical protein
MDLQLSELVEDKKIREVSALTQQILVSLLFGYLDDIWMIFEYVSFRIF